MTGFFAAIAARAAGTPSPLRPRRAQRFEPVHDAGAPSPDAGLVVVDDGAGVAPPGLGQRTREPDPASPRPTAVPAPYGPARYLGQDRRPLEQSPPEPQTGAPTEPFDPSVETVDWTSWSDLDRARQAATAAADRAARLAERPAGRPAAGAAGPAQPEQNSPRPLGLAPDSVPPGPPSSPPVTGPASPDPETPATPASAAPAGVSSHDTEQPQGPRALERPPDQADEARPLPSPPAAPPGPARRTTRARPIDVGAILREQVFAVLNDRGNVPTNLTPVVTPSRPVRPPRPGTAALHAEGVQLDEPSADVQATGDVHVHIARLTVTQPPPPPPPRSVRSETVRRSVDHQAYLARRRERG